MSTALPAAAASAAVGEPRRSWFDGFGIRHLYIVLSFAIAVPLIEVVFVLLMRRAFDVWSLLFEMISCAIFSLCAMASAVATDNRLAGVAGAPVRVAVAVLAAATADSILMEGLISLVIEPLGIPVEDVHLVMHAGAVHRLALHFSGAASWTLMLVTLYSMFEVDRRATAELHAVNVAALAAERDIIEEDLRATQARVNPDLLFDTLMEMERAYATSVASGEKVLEMLIDYLRAALPVSVGGKSTVAKEMELVDSYLALLALNTKVERVDRISVDARVRDAEMPAMLLLPLVRWAIHPSGAARLRVAARYRAATLEITVRSEGASGELSLERDLEGVYQRFGNLYGKSGHIEVSTTRDIRRAAMEIPL